MGCALRDLLTDEVQRSIQNIIDHSRKSLEALRRGDQEMMSRLDKELEMTLGEKERLLGALRQHQQEHGCGVNPISE